MARRSVRTSQFLRDVFIKAGIEAERIVYSRQGHDFPNLSPKMLEKTPALHLRIGYMGQIAPHKGVHVLFEAVRQIPHVTLTVKVYGDYSRFPNYTRRLRRMAQADRRLAMAGVYERTRVSQILRELDAVVVPSLWYENSPNVILEAFAHRTPVIVSDLGGMAELVEDKVNGLRFVSGDASSLAEKLRRLIGERELLTRLKNGIEPVKPLSAEMDELQGIYHSVVSEMGLPREYRCA